MDGEIVKIFKTTYDVEMTSEKKVNLGVWQGAKIRSALNSAIARRYCDNIQYEKCDTCNIDTCMNKYMFMFKPDRKARMQSNPIILDCPFNDTEEVSDQFNFKIHMFSPATNYAEDLVDILNHGVYLGNPRVKFSAVNITPTIETIDLDILENDASDKKDVTIEITFETPFITNAKSGVTPQQIIRNCTTRITSMVNTVGIDYRVPYEDVNEAASQIQFTECSFDNKYYGKQSSRKSKYCMLHGTVGSIKLHGDFSKIYNFLEIASKLNIGKQCTMGFGKFSVRVV